MYLMNLALHGLNFGLLPSCYKGIIWDSGNKVPLKSMIMSRSALLAFLWDQSLITMTL